MFCFNSSKAQQFSVKDFKSSVAPASPEAAILFKFMDIPVSEYTGTPNINVPITGLKNGSLGMDISMSYHASGNKVNEMANWVGLSWKLNAGGQISRKVRGRPDDMYNGFLNFRKTYQYWEIANSPAILDHLILDCGDAQPDEFYFDVNGYSGKFAFDWTYTDEDIPVVNSATPVKLKWNRLNGISE